MSDYQKYKKYKRKYKQAMRQSTGGTFLSGLKSKSKEMTKAEAAKYLNEHAQNVQLWYDAETLQHNDILTTYAKPLPATITYKDDGSMEVIVHYDNKYHLITLIQDRVSFTRLTDGIQISRNESTTDPTPIFSGGTINDQPDEPSDEPSDLHGTVLEIKCEQSQKDELA